ncbi:MAG: hypothetical protein SPK16_03135 [Corynebacterium sp.]|nr:hypothetical protein [Corynebacterium sp.]
MSRKTLPTFAVALALTSSALVVPPMVSTSPVLPSASAQELLDFGSMPVTQHLSGGVQLGFPADPGTESKIPVVTIESGKPWMTITSWGVFECGARSQ